MRKQSVCAEGGGYRKWRHPSPPSRKKKKKLSESPYFSLVGLSFVQSLRDLIEARFDCF